MGESGLDEPKYLQFCSCNCGTNQTLLPLLDEQNRHLPCTNCTRELCLTSEFCNVHQDLVTTKCFQRESLKDQTTVLAFLIFTLALVVLAVSRRFARQ